MTTSTNDAPLTATQRKILTYATTLDGPIMADEIKNRVPNKGQAEEAILTLIARGFVKYHGDGMLTVTDEGHDRADKSRAYNPQRGIHCRACIKVACVCIARIECLGDGPHSLGCHGSHE